MIVGLQIIALLFSVFLIYLATLHYRRKEISKFELLIWISIWTVVSFVILFPDILRRFSRSFLNTRLFDLMVVGGFILVIAMVSKVYLATKRLERKIEKYVRKEALNNTKKDKK